MVENLGDTDGEEKGQQFTPTDWDWVMFLSGEINAIKTRSGTDWTVFKSMECIGLVILITFLSILVSNLNAPNPDSIISIIIWIPVAIIIFTGYRLRQDYNKNESEAEDRVKLLETCRKDIFKRLYDPNKIVEYHSNAVGKKGDKNKRWLIAIPGILALVAVYVVIVLLLVKLFWAWTIPDLFPGAVSQGLVAESISWYTAFKVAIFVAVLAGAQQGRES